MRSAIIAAAFAASVIAVPMEKRNVVVTNTDVEVVYVTEYYTVTGGAQATPAAEAEAEPTPQQYGGNNHWGHNNPHWWGGNKGHGTKKPETTAAATTTAPQATWEPAPTKTKTKTTAQASPPAESPSPAPAPATGYAGVVVQHHNYHRSNHSAVDIEWDEGLASTAAKIAATCVYEHNTEMDGGGYGQNIAAGVDADGVARVITDMFYNGEVNYYTNLYGEDSPDMSNFEKWGHFSQIVWQETTKVGCATQYCSGGLANTGANVPPHFTVCNYNPPGNFANEYSNVGAPVDPPMDTITA